MRASNRKPAVNLHKQLESEVLLFLSNPNEKDFLQVTKCPESAKGLGVFATKDIPSETFLTVFRGVYLSKDEQIEDNNDSVYHVGKHQIDARSVPGYGKYLNDSGKPKDANVQVRLLMINGQDTPVFTAKRKINAGEECVYYYGPGNYPWRESHSKGSTTRVITHTPKKRFGSLTVRPDLSPLCMRRLEIGGDKTDEAANPKMPPRIDCPVCPEPGSSGAPLDPYDAHVDETTHRVVGEPNVLCEQLPDEINDMTKHPRLLTVTSAK